MERKIVFAAFWLLVFATFPVISHVMAFIAIVWLATLLIEAFIKSIKAE